MLRSKCWQRTLKSTREHLPRAKHHCRSLLRAPPSKVLHKRFFRATISPCKTMSRNGRKQHIQSQHLLLTTDGRAVTGFYNVIIVFSNSQPQSSTSGSRLCLIQQKGQAGARIARHHPWCRTIGRVVGAAVNWPILNSTYGLWVISIVLQASLDQPMMMIKPAIYSG